MSLSQVASLYWNVGYVALTYATISFLINDKFSLSNVAAGTPAVCGDVIVWAVILLSDAPLLYVTVCT